MKIDGIEMPFRYVCGSPDGWPTDKPGNSPFSKYVCECCGGEIAFQEFGTFPLVRLDECIRRSYGIPTEAFSGMVFHFQNCPARSGKGERAMVELGRVYRDKITGFEGYCTGQVKYISGCDQALLTPKKGKDGKFESHWFDVQRLEPAGSKVITLDNGKTPGAFDPAPVR